MKDYGEFWGVIEIFKQYSSAIKTHREHFVVGFTKKELVDNFERFIKTDIEFAKRELRLEDTGDWKIETAKEKTKGIDISGYIFDYCYRPFDKRNIIYNLELIERGTNETVEKVYL